MDMYMFIIHFECKGVSLNECSFHVFPYLKGIQPSENVFLWYMDTKLQ